jgi:hypothetical protein
MGNLFSKSTDTPSTLGKRTRGDDGQDHTKRPRIAPIMESQVGISAFMNPDLTGFHCIVKNR